MTHIRAVAFDAFGTVCRIATPTHPYRVLFARLGLDAAQAARFVMTHDHTLAEFIKEHAPSATVNVAAYEHALVAEAASVLLFPEAAGVLSRLLARGLRIAVVSNVAPAHAAALDSLLPSPIVRVWSWEVGALKPDPAIFLHACQRLGFPPSEVVMVGDRVDDDVLGARDAGMHAIHLDRGPEPSPASVRSLEGVEAWLDQVSGAQS